MSIELCHCQTDGYGMVWSTLCKKKTRARTIEYGHVQCVIDLWVCQTRTDPLLIRPDPPCSLRDRRSVACVERGLCQSVLRGLGDRVSYCVLGARDHQQPPGVPSPVSSQCSSSAGPLLGPPPHPHPLHCWDVGGLCVGLV